MFVVLANRIAAIQADSDPAQWRHVPNAQNPANVASRGALHLQVNEHHMWFRGPDYLWSDSN